MSAKKRLERDAVLAIHNNGTLYQVHSFIAQRLQAFEAEVDSAGTFFIAGVSVTDNALWCLLRRDVESKSFDIPSHILRKVVDISFAYIRAHLPPLAQGERVVVVSKFGDRA